MKEIKFVTCKLVKENSKLYEAERKITSPETVKKAVDILIGEDLEVAPEEHFYILMLDTKNKINAVSLISKGSLNASIVHPREVFKPAILNNSASIILVHNHPSGDTQPSIEDRNITNNLIECGKILNIKVLDHIIIGDNYYSFKENALM